MATIIKRGNTWRVQIRRRGYKTVSATFDTRSQAQIWSAEVEAKMARGKWHNADESTTTKLNDALQRYMHEVTPTKKGAKQEQNRIKALCKLPLADWYLAEIRGQQIAEFRDKLLSEGKAPSTIRNFLTIISQVFVTAAGEWGMYELRNPVENVRRPKQRRGRERRLHLNEEVEIIQNLPEPYKQAFIISLETALRRSELCRLTWQDIDLHKCIAKIRNAKNDEDRTIPLSPRAVQTLETLPKTNGTVLGIKSADMYTHKFVDARNAIGSPDLRLHDVRHEATCRLVESRLFELAEVMKITGHKTLAAFQIYLHIQAENLAKRMQNNSGIKE